MFIESPVKELHYRFCCPRFTDIGIIRDLAERELGAAVCHEKLIPKLIRRASNGDSLPIYGDGSNVREWTYVTDNCRAVETVRREGETGATYNIGSDDEQTNLRIARTVCEAVGVSDNLIKFVEDRPGHDQRYALDAQRVRALGWDPTVSFDEELAKTVAYYPE